MLLHSQQCKWRDQAAELWAGRADKAEQWGERSNEIWGGGSSQAPWVSWSHVATGAVKQRCSFADCSAIFSPFIKVNLYYFFCQCSSQSDPTSATQQAQLLLEEKQQLEMHNHQVCTHVRAKLLPSISKCCFDHGLDTFWCRSCWSP